MFCAYTSPRYQVSVYRTIGPLVCDIVFLSSQYLKKRGVRIVWSNSTYKEFNFLHIKVCCLLYFCTVVLWIFSLNFQF